MALYRTNQAYQQPYTHARQQETLPQHHGSTHTLRAHLTQPARQQRVIKPGINQNLSRLESLTRDATA